MNDTILLRVKVFEYGTVVRDQVDLHYPVAEMLCNSKIRSELYVKVCATLSHIHSGVIVRNVSHLFV